MATATARVAALDSVLARSDIWRGESLAQMPLPGVPTGYGELDAELPGGGWPRGGLVELLPARQGLGEMSLLMPALARISSQELSWIVCVAPPLPIFAPAWAAAGVALSRLLVTRASGGDAAWACARALDTSGVGALLAWLPSADAATLRRLQLLAEKSRTLIFLFRPASAVREASPAPLRIALEPGTRSAGNLSVRLLKRRGGARAMPLELELPRPASPPSFSHVVAGTSPTAASARSLPATASV